MDTDIEILIDAFRSNTRCEALDQLRSKVTAFDELKAQRLKCISLVSKNEEQKKDIS